LKRRREKYRRVKKRFGEIKLTGRNRGGGEDCLLVGIKGVGGWGEGGGRRGSKRFT